MLRLFLLIACSFTLSAQVYSPKLLREGQPDSADLKKFAETICIQAHAHTPRERAEAIWRFFLTDGRFVKPGYWYHIAGWTYEEPSGEVLDPVKLLNSYGFGLCYHIAPLLAAVYDAAGFADARCWFLTGHTVTEVFYDGAYHYFDSDMMGYNVPGLGGYRGKPVSSVHDLERQPGIILDKLETPKTVKPGVVDSPWYPADVRAGAMKDMADLFTTTKDNYLYPAARYAQGHSMDFVLRPGETLTRFFKPEEPNLYYLPYRFDGKAWTEFPQEIAAYQIKTVDGPHSQKDSRSWATGRIDYTPPKVTQAMTIIHMPSPYVIIDAKFKMNAAVGEGGHLRVDTSTDNGRTWLKAAELMTAHHGEWTVEPLVKMQSAHGRLTAVSGTYGYDVRITKSADAQIDSLHLASRIQLNPRSLPALSVGKNAFAYSAGPAIERVAIGNPMAAAELEGMERITEKGQSFLRPSTGKTGTALYALEASDLTGFDVGARFLELRDSLAPDKLTAETRHTAVTTVPGAASVSWATSRIGPFHEIWKYDPKIVWRDGTAIDRLLRWPEVFEQVRNLHAKQVFIKLESYGPAIDNIRIAQYSKSSGATGLKITQLWTEDGHRREHIEQLRPGETSHSFAIPATGRVENEAIIFTATP